MKALSMYVTALVLTIFSILLPSSSGARNFRYMPIEAQDTFPVPKNVNNLLFYLQRTTNLNTVIYQLNIDKEGRLNTSEPVAVSWIRFAEKGEHKALNFIQRKYAYGLKVRELGNEQYELRFVSYGKHPLYLMRNAAGQYHIYSTINNKKAELNRVFINIDGGTFWSPNVVYIEIRGFDIETGKEIRERLKP